MGGKETHGHTFDEETSATVARRVRARYRRCWSNASRAAQHLGSSGFYVEGWVVLNRAAPYVIEHGWCEVDGRVVDPSYTPFVTRGLLEPLPPIAYFPGARYRPARAAEAAGRRRLPIAWYESQPGYEEAFSLAWQFAGSCLPPPLAAPARVVNSRREPFDQFIGRPSQWQNPFHIGPDGTREQVVAKYRDWLIRQPTLLRDIHRLRGAVLGCRCAPLPCHGDVLADLANTLGSVMPAATSGATPLTAPAPPAYLSADRRLEYR